MLIISTELKTVSIWGKTYYCKVLWGLKDVRLLESLDYHITLKFERQHCCPHACSEQSDNFIRTNLTAFRLTLFKKSLNQEHYHYWYTCQISEQFTLCLLNYEILTIHISIAYGLRLHETITSSYPKYLETCWFHVEAEIITLSMDK